MEPREKLARELCDLWCRDIPGAHRWHELRPTGRAAYLAQADHILHHFDPKPEPDPLEELNAILNDCLRSIVTMEETARVMSQADRIAELAARWKEWKR